MNIKEYIPKAGMLFQEYSLYPVLCKPKLLPLKSVTLEKLEQMQKEAQDKVIQMEAQSEEQNAGEQTSTRQQQQNVEEDAAANRATTAERFAEEEDGKVTITKPDAGDSTAQNVDVWRPEDDQQDDQDDSQAL